jgi:hypothetical protein
LVHGLLGQLGYSLQSNRKTLEGTDHPDRDAQFEYINARVEEFQDYGLPAISVDAGFATRARDNGQRTPSRAAPVVG